MDLIYVNVVNYPGGYLCPVAAKHVHGQCFEIAGENSDPEHFPWEFDTGQIVTCKQVNFAENECGWLAAELCQRRQRPN